MCWQIYRHLQTYAMRILQLILCIIFGISVAHVLCFHNHFIPQFILPCNGLDVSIWKDCPPQHISLLNISDTNVATAKLGDFATVFGYTNDQARTWRGSIVGYLNSNSSGVHFTNQVFDHAEELLFQGAQESGMSGGGAINGRGKALIL